MAIKQTVFSAVACLVGIALAASPTAGEVASAGVLFERAETLYRQLRTVDPECADDASWNRLLTAFGRIPVEFPANPLAGDALWRIGDIHLRRMAAGDLDAVVAAQAAYESLTKRYPSNVYAPEAYLRLGDLARPSESSGYYFRLLESFPGSPQAEEASRRIIGGRRSAAPDTVVADNSTVEVPAAEPVARDTPPSSDKQPPVEELETMPTPVSGPSAGRVSVETETAEAPITTTVASVATTAVEAAAAGEVSQPAASTLAPTVTGRVLSVRHFSDGKHTRVVFDLDNPVQHRIGEALAPPRVFIDLIGADLAKSLPRSVAINGSGVRQIRLAVNRPGVVRAVLDLTGAVEYSFFTLTRPPRLVLDIPSAAMSKRLANARRPDPPEGGSEARQLGFGVRRIVIDPGHGGTSPGAIGRSGSTEKELTLDISRRVAGNLRDSQYEVSLTRSDDSNIDLEDRASFATRSGADLFVSIHVNSSTNRNLTGFETYYLDLATDPTAAETAARENLTARGGVGGLNEVLDEIVRNANKRESRDLATSIQDSLVMQMSKQYGDVRDLGVKHAPFVVLVGAEMPAVLVEVSFLSNPTEETRLNDDAYRQQVADAIHIGIENFVERRRMVSAAE